MQLQSELMLMQGIIPDKSRKIVFEKVVMQSMENLVSEGEVRHFSFRYFVLFSFCTGMPSHKLDIQWSPRFI